MFSMFFGSGNLVFPLVIGQTSADNYPVAAIGLVLTGVLVPFLGLVGIKTFKGNYSEFFAKMGKHMSWVIPLILLSLLGPFAVVPRCITVAHGSFSLIFSDITLWQFSSVFCSIMFILCLDKNKIIPLVGAVLTPALLLSLAFIIYRGIVEAPEIDPSTLSQGNIFFFSLEKAFMTMDLIAAFFFSSVVIYHIHSRLEHYGVPKESENTIIVGALLIGATILGSVYAAFVFLGSSYNGSFAGVTPEKYLAIIAFKTMGQYAAPILCCAVVLACLTTAVVLCSLFSEFILNLLGRGRKIYALIISVALSFAVSTYEFNGIALVLSPILDALYPALIILTLLNIANRLWGYNYIKTPVWTVFAISAAFVASDFMK